MNKPDLVTINVREYAGTYIATAKEVKLRASCTSGKETAAHVCAHKIYGSTPEGKDAFTLKKVTDQTFIAEPVKPERTSVWRKDHPDADIQVIARMESDEYPLVPASYDGEKWMIGFDDLNGVVVGWMHMEDAARILDAATL